MKLHIQGSEVNAELDKKEKLPLLSLAIQMALEYQFGCGVWAIHLIRTWNPKDNSLSIQCRAMTAGHGLAISSMSQMGVLFEQLKWFPKKLQDSQKFKLKQGQEGTITQYTDMDLESSICKVCFALADHITGSFFRGAEQCHMLISQELSQVWFDLGMSPKELLETEMDPKDYNEALTVGDMK